MERFGIKVVSETPTIDNGKIKVREFLSETYARMEWDLSYKPKNSFW